MKGVNAEYFMMDDKFEFRVHACINSLGLMLVMKNVDLLHELANALRLLLVANVGVLLNNSLCF